MNGIYYYQQKTGVSTSDLFKYICAILLTIVLNGPIASSFAQDLPPELGQAQQAFNTGQYQQALALLKPLEATQAGVVEFDYLFGRAALETGDLNTAIAALSRVLSLDPGFAGARLELARTYYSKGVKEHSRGSFEQARSEFDNVLEQNPPLHIKKSIEDYQLIIDKYLEVRHLNTHAFAELTGGYDSNVNSGPSLGYFSFYDIFSSQVHSVKLFESAQRTESWFGGVKLGGQIILPLFSRYFDAFASFRAGSNTFDSAHRFDHDTFAGEFGAHHYGDSNKKTFSMNFTNTDINGRRYADEFYAKLEWAQRIDESNMLTGKLVGGDVNYDGDYWPMSVSGGRLGLEWTHLTGSTAKTSYQVLALLGNDDSQKCDMDCKTFYRREISGLRFALSSNVFSQSRLYTSIYMEHSDYQEWFFERQRRDRRYELFLGMNTHLSQSWTIRPELHYIYNDSNIELFGYKRAIGSISLRREF